MRRQLSFKLTGRPGPSLESMGTLEACLPLLF